MKPVKSCPFAHMRINFISHIVQMKHGTVIDTSSDLELYIPHSSDETLISGKAILDISDFISHIVQMKLDRPN